MKMFHFPETLKQWLHTIISAFIGGAAGSLSVAVVDPATFNFSHAGLIKLGKVAVISGAIPVLAYLKTYPTPMDITKTTVTASVTETVTKEKL